jgi:hypothetical protein
VSQRQADHQPEPLSGWRWWTGLAAGGAVGLFGLAGLLRDAAKAMPAVWLKWLVGLLLVHDFVFAPLVNLVGRRLRDRTPKAWRWPLQLGLVTSGVLVLASVPGLLGVERATQPVTPRCCPATTPSPSPASSPWSGWASSPSGSGECVAPGGDPSIWFLFVPKPKCSLDTSSPGGGAW